jgi:hypothetical protein
MFSFFKKYLCCFNYKKNNSIKKDKYYYIKKYGSEGNRFIINNEL